MNSTFTNSSLNLMDDQLSYITSVPILTVQMINFCLGIPLNVYVMFLLTRPGSLDESVIFILNQCISETLYALSAPVYVLCKSFNIYSVRLLNVFFRLFICASPLFQCCVCLERYLAVVHPVMFLKFKHLRFRVGCSIVIWACMLFFTITTTVLLLPFDYFAGLYAIIMVIDLFCCVSILRALRKPGPGDRIMKKVEIGKKNFKNKAFNIVFVNLMTFLVLAISLSVVLCVKYCFFQNGIYNLVSNVAVTVNIIAGFIPVLLYLHNARKLNCLGRFDCTCIGHI